MPRNHDDYSGAALNRNIGFDPWEALFRDIGAPHQPVNRRITTSLRVKPFLECHPRKGRVQLRRWRLLYARDNFIHIFVGWSFEPETNRQLSARNSATNIRVFTNASLRVSDAASSLAC